MDISLYNTNRSPTWCPGCGNYGIWASLKGAFTKMEWKEDSFVAVYGIGCSGNMTDFVKSYGFHSLHGRGIPNAVGIKIANHNLPVIVIAGDGDIYGEGGNHLVHAARGNHDIKVIVHDNRVYGLTTGQVAPTAAKGFKSKSTPNGIIEVRLNPLALAIVSGATFVAQGFAGDIPHLTELLITAFKHRGFTLVNILQPCVTFNKINTFEYYRERTFKLDQKYDPSSKNEAITKVLNEEKFPLGIIYREERPTYQDSLPQLSGGPLVEKQLNNNLNELFKEFI